MSQTNLSKRSNVDTDHSSVGNKRLRVDDEVLTAGSNESVARSSIVVPIFSQPGVESGVSQDISMLTPAGLPEFLPPSPESPQPHQLQGDTDIDSDSDTTTILAPDDFESSLPDLEFGDGGVSSSEEDNDDFNMMISEGVYADLLRAIRQRTGYCYPVAMVVKLETNRLRVLNQSPLQTPSALAAPLSRKAYIIMHAWDPECCYSKTRVREYEIVGTALSQEKANVEAMAYFYLKNPRYLCRSEVVARDLQNAWKAPFLEVKKYNNADCFEEFCKEFGTKDCSAWGIDEAGCLGLLANHGLSSFDMVYVEEKELFA
ncbi:hypothetical protein F5Y13DRAFT_193794 [Hypoxylon sp. FL1857]|nr:hypothetical protein F5Y13DRAFT_193794 [Hypoxylon sp. FL1857]